MKIYIAFLFFGIISVIVAQTTVYADEKYGFDPENSQTNFYDAIKGEKNTGNTLIFRNMGSPWYLMDPYRLFDVDNLTIVFEPGCIIEAKKGEWHSNERLFNVLRATNFHVVGYGATFKMHKSDFPEGEFGYSFGIYKADNFSIKGLTLDGSGGDGIYVQDWNNSLIEDVDAVGHKRQGITIVACTQLNIRNSKFRNTSGTNPSAGVDIEPDEYRHNVVGCRFDNCSFTGNDFVGIAVALTYTDNRADDVDITFSNCYSANNNSEPPYTVGAINSGISGNSNANGTVDMAVGGHVTFKNIAIDGDPRGLWFNRKQFNGYKAVLDNVVGINLSASSSFPLIGFETPSYDFDAGNGGVNFNDVLVHTTQNVVPFHVRGTNASASGKYLGLRDVGGKITVVAPFGNAPEYINYDSKDNVNVTYSYTAQTSLPSTTVTIKTIVDKAAKTGQVGKARISRTSSRIDYPLFVKYSVSSPKVSQGNDIHYLTGAVIIEAGQTSTDIEIVARDNGIVEPSRPVVLSLENRVLYNIGSNSTTEITIVDDL